MHIRVTQLDGRLPNIALMKIAAHHRSRGDVVHFSRSPYRDMLEPEYGAVYGSAIFDFSAERVEHRTLAEFQRWAIRKAYTFIPFEAYDVNAKGRGILGQGELLEPF